MDSLFRVIDSEGLCRIFCRDNNNVDDLVHQSIEEILLSDQSSGESEQESSEDSPDPEEEEEEMSDDSALSVPEKTRSKGKRKKGKRPTSK